MSVLNLLGNSVGALGRLVGAPELGLSEALGGNGIDGNGDNRIQNVTGDALNTYNTGNAQRVADLAAPTNTTASTSAATSTATNDALIDSLLGRLGNQQAVGEGNIQSSYQSALDRLINGKTAALSNYDTQKNQTIQDNVKAKASIDDGVRSSLQGLQRLLGAHGAGNSSASAIVAPYAAGRQGTVQRAGVQDAFGRNVSAIDKAVGDYKQNFDLSVGDLNADKENKHNALIASILGTKSNLLSQRSNAAANVGDINALGGQIDSLGKNVTFDPKLVTAAAPNLNAYSVNKVAPTMNGVDPTLAANLGGYYSLLGNKDKKLTSASA